MAKATRAPVESNISRRRRNARTEGNDEYAAKRSELTAIASALFKENGYEQTTLAHVAERAGLDRATVYYYVGNKQELFQTAIEGILDENLASAEALVVNESLTPHDKLRAMIVLLMESYDRNYPQMYVYIQEQMHQVEKDDSKWAREIQRKTRRMEAIVRELIERGVADGTLRSDLDARVCVKSLFGMLNWTSRWYKPNSRLSAASIAETFCKLFFEGMLAQR